MKINEIYEKYKIMPNLQFHMLRVAAVASLICDNFRKEAHKSSIISACLLHDMGNIVKFKLDRFPEFLEPEGFEYWFKVQQDFIQKYGEEDYSVTYKILNEMKVPSRIVKLIKSIEFAKAPQSAISDNFERKICIYSDLRVAPLGIVSLEERLTEVKSRYIRNKKVTEAFFDNLSSSMREIEKQVFKYCKLKPEDISDSELRQTIENLARFEV